MPPVVLGIDTSSSWCSAALLRGTQVFVRRAEVGNAHSDHLLTMIDAVLADAGLPLGACDALAFAAGPGSFTGLRVACAAVQGLAFGAGRPVAAIGTLEAIAHAASAAHPSARSLLVAQDARMGEVYWMTMRRQEAGWTADDVPALASPAHMREVLEARDPEARFDLGCGNAWNLHATLADLVRRIERRDGADAVDVAVLGADALRAGRLIAPELASPLYVRNDVAQTTAQRAATARSRHAQASAMDGATHAAMGGAGRA